MIKVGEQEYVKDTLIAETEFVLGAVEAAKEKSKAPLSATSEHDERNKGEGRGSSGEGKSSSNGKVDDITERGRVGD